MSNIKKSCSTGNLLTSLLTAAVAPKKKEETMTVETPTSPKNNGKSSESRSRTKKSSRTRRCNSDNTMPTATLGDSSHFFLDETSLREDEDPLCLSPRGGTGTVKAKTEEEMLADMFRTAKELEEVARKARRANRRRSTKATEGTGTTSTGRRRSTSSKGKAKEEEDDDDRSVASSKSTFSLSRILSPRSKPNPTKSPKSTGRTSSRRSRRSRSLTRLEQPKCGANTDLDANMDSSTPCHHLAKPINIYKPTYYHDSEDDDDDLILQSDDDLDDFSRRVQNEVLNMTIQVDWR
jgi:hypothetical protein